MKIKFIKANQLYILSFLLPFFAMFFIFAFRGIYPFGDRSFLHIDMYHQYFPFLTEFYHKLTTGDSLLYSWNTGMGSNFLALYVYYLASPFNWLVVLCSEAHLMEFISYMVVFKIGLCGLSFSYYISKHFQTKRLSILLFATAYALSGYMAAYNWNVMWLDCIVLAPLVMLGLERLVNEGKVAFYFVTLALCIFTNYYLSIMICIYLVCYFLVLLISAEHKWKAILRFGIYSLLAGGAAAILLLPELEMLLLTSFTNSNFPKTVTSYFSIIDCLARQFMDVTVETGLDHWPNIYCGVLVLLLFPLYLFCGKIPVRERAAKASLLVFLLASFSTNVLSFIWHGFNYPDSLPSRQSFLYILLLLTVCFEATLHLKDFSIKVIGGIVLGAGIFVLLCQKLITDDAFSIETYFYTAVFLIVYAILMHYYRTRTNRRRLVTYICIAVVFIELTLNTLLTSVPTVSRSNYLSDFDEYETLVSQIQEQDSDFYRIEKEKHITQNDAMLIGFPSASLFSSTANHLVNQFYETYGMRTSRVFYSNTGMTPFTSALLSTRYFFSGSDKEKDSLYHLAANEGNLYLYENTYTLPLGYLITTPEAVLEDSTEDAPDMGDISEILDENPNGNPVIAQNTLAQRMGSSEALFTPLSVTEDESNTSIIEVAADAHIYAYVGNTSIATVTCQDDDSSQDFTKLKNSYILDLGYHTAGDVIKLSDNDDTQTRKLRLSAYSLNEPALSNLTHTLNEQALIVDSFDSTHVNGHIDVANAGTLVLSIPYDIFLCQLYDTRL